MKLSDINKDLNEAPVGRLSRMMTKMKKHTPFNPEARAEARGRDVTEIAANEINLAFREWLGRNIKIKKDAIPASAIKKFLYSNNMGDTGAEIVDAKAQEKLKKNESVTLRGRFIQILEADEDDLWSQPGWDKIKQAAEQEAEELGAEEDENVERLTPDNVTFDVKEVEQMLLDIVGEIHQENPEGLDAWVATKSKKEKGSRESNQDEPSLDLVDADAQSAIEKLEPAEVDALGDVLDTYSAGLLKIVNGSKIDAKEKKRINAQVVKALQQVSKEVGFKLG